MGKGTRGSPPASERSSVGKIKKRKGAEKKTGGGTNKGEGRPMKEASTLSSQAAKPSTCGEGGNGGQKGSKKG